MRKECEGVGVPKYGHDNKREMSRATKGTSERNNDSEAV